MGDHDAIAVTALAVSLIGTLVVTTWKFATMTTEIREALKQVKHYARRVPRLTKRVEFLENHLHIRPSRPDFDDEPTPGEEHES